MVWAQSITDLSAKKSIWKRKVEQVAEESDSLRFALERFAGREAKRNLEAAQRDELLRRTATGSMGGMQA